MVLAETVAGGVGDHTDKRWLFIDGWADASQPVGQVADLWKCFVRGGWELY